MLHPYKLKWKQNIEAFKPTNISYILSMTLEKVQRNMYTNFGTNYVTQLYYSRTYNRNTWGKKPDLP
jgi:hypothetical protein